jgi:hypothetical protein
MVFIPLQRDSGATRTYLTALSQTFVKWQALVFSSGYVTPATSSAAEVFLTANEAVTLSASVHQPIKCLNSYAANITYTVGCATQPVQSTHCGNKYDLSTGLLLDLTGTTHKVFLVEEIVDTVNYIVKWHFVKKPT